MATAATDRYTPPPLSLPEGTCVRTEDGASLYWVKGSAQWYVVNADTGECHCESYVWRCSASFGDLCKHGQRLARYLAELTACPACKGKRYITPSGIVRYVTLTGDLDLGPWPCAVCSGTGERSALLDP